MAFSVLGEGVENMIIVSYFDCETFLNYTRVSVSCNNSCERVAHQFMAKHYEWFLNRTLCHMNNKLVRNKLFDRLIDICNHTVYFDKLVGFICNVKRSIAMSRRKNKFTVDEMIDRLIRRLKRSNYMYEWDPTEFCFMTYKMLQLYVECGGLISYKSDPKHKRHLFSADWLHQKHRIVCAITSASWGVKWLIHDFICKTDYNNLRTRTSSDKKMPIHSSIIFTETKRVISILANQVYYLIKRNDDLWRLT